MKLTIEQTAQQAGVSELIIKKWIESGKLDNSRTDNVICLEAIALQEFINQDKKESAQRIFNQRVEVGKRRTK